MRKLEIRPLALDGVVEIRPPRFGDERGFFSPVWSAGDLVAAGFELDFVQDSHSYSAARGVLRGLHYQARPAAQQKLVRVSRGSVFDVAVDVRQGSPTFGLWAGLTLSAELWNQLLVPEGFAHGFVTLEEDTEVQYKVTASYRPDLERSIRYDDPDIGIDWPVPASEIRLSARDQAAPLLSSGPTGF